MSRLRPPLRSTNVRKKKPFHRASYISERLRLIIFYLVFRIFVHFSLIQLMIFWPWVGVIRRMPLNIKAVPGMIGMNQPMKPRMISNRPPVIWRLRLIIGRWGWLRWLGLWFWAFFDGLKIEVGGSDG